MVVVAIEGYHDWHIDPTCIESFNRINNTKTHSVGVVVRTKSGDTRKYYWYPHNDGKRERKGKPISAAEDLVEELHKFLENITNE